MFSEFTGVDDDSLEDQPVVNDDLSCPICCCTLESPFVTPCGHTYCYSCITQHLATRRSCPSCSAFLTNEQIYPNFLLNKASGLN